jgi:hypothetical protein
MFSSLRLNSPGYAIFSQLSAFGPAWLSSLAHLFCMTHFLLGHLATVVSQMGTVATYDLGHLAAVVSQKGVAAT